MSDNPKLFEGITPGDSGAYYTSITLRDFYIGIMAHAVVGKAAVFPRDHEDIVASTAVKLADALLAERAKGK